MDAVRERALEAPVSELHELVIRHELQHTETMLQAMALGGAPAAVVRRPAGRHRHRPGDGRGGRGAGGDRHARPEGFAYDNERPRHTRVDGAVHDRPHAGHQRHLADASPRAAATNAASGGRTRAGRGRRSTTSPTTPPAEAGDRDAPVVHVSWFEAAAFARAHDARLPTEIEWEKAATWGQLEGTGEVWEWTASHFIGYPGFVAHPYREYSEVFFGDRYRVLRGGSCATHPRVASPQFRNWDLPERRQLFAGVRIAR